MRSDPSPASTLACVDPPASTPGLLSTLLSHDRISDRSEHPLPQLQEKLAGPAQQHVIETLGGVGARDAAHGTMNV